MKFLKNILSQVDVLEIVGSADISINAIHFDSRKVESNNLFVATTGTQVDGHVFIDKAIALGATAIICENLPAQQQKEVCYIKVQNSHFVLGQVSSAWYDHPSRKLKLVGITGTNGKTTIASLLYQLYMDMGYFTGLLSTIENKIGKQSIKSTHTTPDALSINHLLHEMVAHKCEYCFMEVSSHALHQGRTAGLDFDGGIFTNITHDHLDYHNSFAEYIKAKKIFFDNLKKDAFALTNIDDKNGMLMLQNCSAEKQTYSLQSLGDFKARIIENQINGLNLTINDQDVWFRLTGRFNAYNLLAVYGTAILLGQDSQEILSTLSNAQPVNGRFEAISAPNGTVAIVDYAHTPDALLHVLKTLKDIKQAEESIITVVGAGGNRDKTKRPEMARIAADYSDRVILTSDNPRFEKPDDIIDDMKAGLNAQQSSITLAISKRDEAIKTAYAIAKAKDFILIAGKGHETYQDIEGVKHHFDDKEIITNLFDKN